MIARIQQILLALGVIGALAFLFVKTQATHIAEHNHIAENLGRAKQLDATLTEILLESRYALLTNYDPLVQTLSDLKALQVGNRKELHALYPKEVKNLDAQLDSYDGTLAQKEDIIEEFKSENAILKNSLTYLPTIIGHALREISADGQGQAGPQLSALLHDTLIYSQNSNKPLHDSLTAQLQALERYNSAYRSETQSDFNMALAHARTVLQYKDTLDSRLVQFVSLPGAKRSDDIYRNEQTLYQQTLQQANGYRLVLALFCAALVIAVAYILQRLKKSATALYEANSNLEARVAERTASLTEANAILDQTLDEFRQLIEGVTASADTVASTSSDLSLAVSKAGAAAQEVTANIQDVARAADQTAHTSQDIAVGNEKQAHSVDRAAHAMQQLQAALAQVQTGDRQQQHAVEQADTGMQQAATAVEAVTSQTLEMAQTAQQAATVAATGGQAVQQTIASMDRIQQQMQTSAGKVRELGEKGQQIGEIVETINQIAEQTNLLALNAAIEAARAGEHGRGFAVVADEVRKLAERATSATSEIGNLIGSVQTGVEEVVRTMEISNREVSEGAAHSQKAGGALHEIVAAAQSVASKVERVSETTQIMAEAVQAVRTSVAAVRQVTEGSRQAVLEMATDAQQVAEALTGAATITEKTAAGAEEMSATAEEVSASAQYVAGAVTTQTTSLDAITASAENLRDMANRLQELIHRFQSDAIALPEPEIVAPKPRRKMPFRKAA
ncbi:MAG TPA: methyl-accepting chemotaxis protein [Chthonomonadaceae bacterium]|nr:methyl-accepting chemotaxis protein [Chthonomonadaceae bacterium]